MSIATVRNVLNSSVLALTLACGGGPHRVPERAEPGLSNNSTLPKPEAPPDPGVAAQTNEPKPSPAPSVEPSVPAPPPPPLPPIPKQLPKHQLYDSLDAALLALIPKQPRVIGIGELHSRTDRPVASSVKSSLAHMTAALSAVAPQVTDLVIETWIADPNCGASAVEATTAIETEVKRPAATKNEVTLLAEAARALNVQPHAMKLSCDDYKTLRPNGHVDPLAMLTLTTRELTRISTSAVAYRARHADPRPWVIVYGGALHNDRFPTKPLAEWSVAKAVDRATHNRFVEIDLIVPEIALLDLPSQNQPWFALAQVASDKVIVWKRGERSFVVILPKSP